MPRLPRFTALALAAALCSCSRKVPSGAEVVFDVDFSSPEQTVNAPVQTAGPGKGETWPSRVPTAVFFGHPIVVDRFCGLDRQPLRITSATGDNNIEGVVFSLDPRWGRYHFEFDLCVNQNETTGSLNRDPPAVVFLDMINAHAIGFDPAGQITVTLPAPDPNNPTAPQKIGNYQRKKPVHVAVDVDFENKSWRIALDGKTALQDSPVVVNVPGSMRVLARGNPSVQLGLDNVLIWGEHDRFAGQEDNEDVPDGGAEPEKPPEPEKK
jgi:hypothetical protein